MAADSLALILTALRVGTTVMAGDAIKNSYDGLKKLLQDKFAAKPSIRIALEKYEEKPDIWSEPLKDELAEVNISQYEEIVRAAQRVIAIAGSQQPAMGKYNIQITGNVQGFVQGDSNTTTINFPVSKQLA